MIARHFAFPQAPAAAVGATELAGVAALLDVSWGAAEAPATTDDEGVAERTAVTAVAVPPIWEMTGGWMFIEEGGLLGTDACEGWTEVAAGDVAEACSEGAEVALDD